MEDPSVDFSLDELLNELDSLDAESRSTFLLALMLRDGFWATAPFVPAKYREGLKDLIRSLAMSDLILDWDGNIKPNTYRSILNEWIGELDRAGWPPERPRPATTPEAT